MKKLLLVLFISFGLIGSANANSIKGAFGYNLGDVDKSIETKEEFLASWFYYAWKTFTPKNPVPFFDSYRVRATPISHRIYEIEASKSIKEKSKGVQYDWCEYGSGLSFSDLLAILRARYGDVFDKVVHKYDRGTYSDGINWHTRHYALKYTDKNRYIHLSCRHKASSIYSYELSLKYVDTYLEDLEDIEYTELKNKKILEESSDYDL
jgi:hypothetical protein